MPFKKSLMTLLKLPHICSARRKSLQNARMGASHSRENNKVEIEKDGFKYKEGVQKVHLHLELWSISAI